MTKNEKLNHAKQIFEEGFNCCQAVFVPFAMENGINKPESYRLSSGFAAGLCYQGETCGAVIGAQMAIGLNNGYSETDDDEGRDKVREKITLYRNKFEQKNGSTLCKELLGADVATEDGLNYLRENGIFQEKCPKIVTDSVVILQSVLNE